MELPIAPNSPGGTSGGFFRRAATARAAWSWSWSWSWC